MNALTTRYLRLAALVAVLIAFSTAIPVRAGEKPSAIAIEVDSLAREFIPAAEKYQQTVGDTVARSKDPVLGMPPYAVWMRRIDATVDSALSAARNVAKKAEPVNVILQRLARRGRDVDVSMLPYWQNEVEDAAKPLLRLAGYLKGEENGLNEPDGKHLGAFHGFYLDTAPDLAPISRASDSIVKGLRDRMNLGKIAAEIKRDENVIRLFRMKLVDGFPAYPWEYLWNLTGDRMHPARWQFIIAHPTFGFHLAGPGSDLNPKDFRIENWHPAMQIEIGGINCYFFNRWMNYVGVSAVAWKSLGGDGGGYGFDAHLANWTTLGVSILNGDRDYEPSLMVGWTATTGRLLDVFK